VNDVLLARYKGEPSQREGLLVGMELRATSLKLSLSWVNARFLVVEERHVSGTLGGDGELDGLRFYGMAEALALELALPTRRVLERLKLWLALPNTERGTQSETPVLLRDRGWLME